MPIDLKRLSESELIDLNRRVADRLMLIRKARQLSVLSRFAVGSAVEFTVDGGRVIRGTISRLDRQSATVINPLGSWRVSPSLLRQGAKPEPSRIPAQPLVFPRHRHAD